MDLKRTLPLLAALVAPVNAMEPIANPEQAARILQESSTFADQGVGIRGATPPEHVAVAYLATHPGGKEAALKLMASENLCAQLYGLCVLYHVDKEGFAAHVARLRTSTAKVTKFDGCVKHPEAVATIVFNAQAGTSRILLNGPGETVAQAVDRMAKAGETAFVRDISGGAMPAIILEKGSK